MNHRRLVQLVLAFSLACAASRPFAQQALEIIPLRYRTVEQVLPALQPLVEPGGTLSGARNQLFLRASPANAAEIKRALEAIDRPLKRLQISVRLDEAQDRERRALGASGTISNRGARVDVTAEDARRAAAGRVDQRIQVLEGGRATILDVGTGFEVVPRLAGGVVVLDIFQTGQRELASTSVSARLGEWIEIAGVQSERSRDERGIASASRARGVESRRVWLKVEELD
jgi:hypothetical protein